MWNRGLKRNLACALILVAGTLAGCGGESEDAQIIRDAKQDLEYLAAREGRMASELGAKHRSYDQILSSLNKVASSSNPGDAAAAAMLRARAYARQADAAFGAASAAENEIMVRTDAVRMLLVNWHALNAQAAALRAYDPAEALASIDKQIATNAADVAQVQAQIEEQQAALEKLKAEADAAFGKSREQRGREAEIRARAVGKSETERADLIEQANKAKRDGDVFDKAGSDVQALIQIRTPAVDETRLRLAELESNRKVLEQSKAELSRLHTVNTEQAARLADGGQDRVGAKQTAERIAAELQKIEDLRAKADADQSLADIYQSAESLFSKAISDAAKAGGSKPGAGAGTSEGGSLDAASYQQSLADVLMSKARGLGAHAALMLDLSEAVPALPGDFAAKAAQNTKEFDEALSAARDAYTSARERYDSAGARVRSERIKTRVEAISKMLARLDPRSPAPADDAAPSDGASPDNASSDGAAPDRGDATPTAPDNAALPSGFEGEVISAAEELSALLKKRDFPGFIDHVVLRNPSQREPFLRAAPFLGSALDFADAVSEQFGESLEELAVAHDPTYEKGSPSDESPFASVEGVLFFATSPSSDFDVSASPADPDLAILKSQSGVYTGSFTFARTDGAWKLRFDAVNPLGGPGMDKASDAIKGVFDSMTADVKAGKYAGAPAKLFTDMQTRMQAAVAKAIMGEPK